MALNPLSAHQRQRDASIWGYATRAALISAAIAPLDGTEVAAGGFSYVRQSGAAIIPDMPGWVPGGVWSMAHFGVTGSGDETARVQAAFNAAAGRVLRGINATVTVTSVTIPDARIVFEDNGMLFRRLAASPTPIVTILGNLTFLQIRVLGSGGTNDRGIRVSGDYVRGGILEAIAETESSTTGVHIQPQGAGTMSNLEINRILVGRYRAGVHGVRITQSRIDGFRIRIYVTGAYFVDCSYSTFARGDCKLMHSAAGGTAGENGLLCEATTDGAFNNVHFDEWSIEDSGEHGVRFGGQATISNVWLTNTRTKNTGAAGAGASGGAGIKVLGATDRVARHRNFVITGAVVEDCSTEGTGQGNFCGVQVGNLDGLILTGIIRAKDKPYSCWDGITATNISNARIDVQALDCRRMPIRLLSENLTAGDNNETRDVTITGVAHTLDAGAGGVCVSFWDPSLTPRTGQFIRVAVKMRAIGGVIAVRALDRTDAGTAYIDVSTDVEYSGPTSTAGGPPLQNSNAVLHRFAGPWYGTFGATAKDGSTFIDTTTGTIRDRVSGAWRARYPSAFSGVFTDDDGRTLTVSNGIITSVAP